MEKSKQIYSEKRENEGNASRKGISFPGKNLEVKVKATGHLQKHI